MRKIQFRYDGSDDAKKALEWVNEQRALKGLAFWNPSGYFDFNCDWWDQPFPDYTLVTPTDFLREVNNQEWMPTVGDRVAFASFNYEVVWAHGNKVWIKSDGEGFLVDKEFVKPYIPSLPEQLQSYIQDTYRTYIPNEGIKNIIEMVTNNQK